MISVSINKGCVKGVASAGGINNRDLKARMARLFLRADRDNAIGAAGHHQSRLTNISDATHAVPEIQDRNDTGGETVLIKNSNIGKV